jgi:sulfur carrier protein
MKLWINGVEHETHCVTLAELLAQVAHESAGVATAIDGEFVSRTARGATPLMPGMYIDIVAPIQGG